MVNTIICPHCGQNFEITEALAHELKNEISASLKEEYRKKLEEAKEKSLEIAKKEVAETQNIELERLKKELSEKDKKMDELREQEIKLREEKRELKEKEKELDLKFQRQIDEEKKKIEETVSKQAFEEHRHKDLEKEKIIEDLKKSLEEAQRKASLGSQQLQGEVLELDLEKTLRSAFPFDAIEPIGKGVRGADIRQIVKTQRGNTCGVILWETKRTKAWSDEWIVKLKDDLRAEKANVPVIVSMTLPKEVDSGMGFKDGVWVCSFSLFLPLAELLHQKLVDVAREKFILQNRGEKTEELYQYITGFEFRQHVESLAEIYKDMNDQIFKERVAFEKAWKSREAQVKKLFTTTARMIGDISGTIGTSSLGQIKGLDMFELESGEK